MKEKESLIKRSRTLYNTIREMLCYYHRVFKHLEATENWKHLFQLPHYWNTQKTATLSRLFVHHFTEKPNKLAQRSTSNWKVFILSDDFISALFCLSSVWWRSSAPKRTKATNRSTPNGKETQHIFRHNQLILIAWKLLFIYGIERKIKK